jgi:hypothetical protein
MAILLEESACYDGDAGRLFADRITLLLAFWAGKERGGERGGGKGMSYKEVG